MTTSLRFLAGIVIGCVPLIAHDMWIEPATFFPQTGDLVGVKLRVGQDLLGDALPRDPKLIKYLVVEDSEGRKPLVGRTGADPAGYMRVAAPGMHVIGYSSNPSPVELGAEKFNQYLKDEGLDDIAKVRAGAKVRELFSRCAKSLVLVGPASDTDGDHALGCALELVAERNPYALHSSRNLPLQLKYENRPLAGALVVAINKQNPAEKVTARTGKDGRVQLALRTGGLWMIKAVHIIPSVDASADWVSYWASLTFELRSGK